MEGLPTSQTPERVPEKKEEALRRVIDSFYEKLGARSGNTFESNGRTYELESIADGIVGDAQHATEAADSILEAVRGTDYYEEKYAAQLAATMRNREAYVKGLAVLQSASTEEAARLSDAYPEIEQITKKGEERLSAVRDAA